MSCAPEVWRDVVGFEGLYEVSTAGRVWSVRARRCLRPGPSSGGHLSVALGRGNTRMVHAVVLATFAGPRPTPKHDGRHLNGRHVDNDLLNLEWSTRARNSQDKKWHRGQKTYRLSPAQVVEIKSLLADGIKGCAIARTYGVAETTISAIKHERFHADV